MPGLMHRVGYAYARTHAPGELLVGSGIATAVEAEHNLLQRRQIHLTTFPV
jgi:hypothetical protein